MLASSSADCQGARVRMRGVYASILSPMSPVQFSESASTMLLDSPYGRRMVVKPERCDTSHIKRMDQAIEQSFGEYPPIDMTQPRRGTA